MTATPLAMQSFYNQNKNSTPSSPYTSNQVNTSTGSPYLPGYLLGGNTSSPNSGNYGRSLSSGGFSRNSTSHSKLNSRSPPHSSMGSPYASPPDRKQQRMLRSSAHQMRDKPGAPPTESLYSANTVSNMMEVESETPRKTAAFLNAYTHGDTFLTPKQSPEKTALDSSVFSPRIDSILQSPAQMDPFYSEGDAITSSDVLDQTAVTVFGFPPAASSYILQQFAQYGTIDKHEIHNNGNWLHIKYQTKIQAKKALSKNGKIFSRSIMIGVLPCIRKEIASMQAEFDITQLNQTPRDFMQNKKNSTMRPLSSTTGVTPLRNAAIPSLLDNDKGTPQKKESVVSKALDYVFGW